MADSPNSKPPAGGQQPAQQITLDYSKASTCYANFCHVTTTPEEVVLYLGLNTPAEQSTGTVGINQRLVLSYYTAKRLLGGLARVVQHHETEFGVLETDVQKRSRSNPRP